MSFQIANYRVRTNGQNGSNRLALGGLYEVACPTVRIESIPLWKRHMVSMQRLSYSFITSQKMGHRV
jgi:hypothetical protein